QIPQLQLTERAVQRLGIVTQPVRPTTTASQPAREIIPYSAVVYDTDGSTWAYVNTAARTYERKPITVTEIDGEIAPLSAGPAAGLMILGITSLPQMHVDVFPEFAPPRVVIQTACVGLSTSDVEQLVTVPLEAGLNGIQGLDDMRSKSVPQLSSIELLFKPGTDLLRARQLVQERIATVSPSLPTWAAPPVMMAPVSATGRAMQIGMTSKNHSLIEMSMT